MQWIIAPLKKYAEFNGRARRTEFWVFFLFFGVLTLLANYLDKLDGTHTPVAAGMGVVELVVSLLLLLPFIAVGVRRLHDAERSGWWMLLLYIPYLSVVAARGDQQLMLVTSGAIVVGAVGLFTMLLLPGTPGANRFGSNPRGLPDE